MNTDQEDLNIRGTCHLGMAKQHNRAAKVGLYNTNKDKQGHPTHPRAPGGRVYMIRQEEAEDAPNVMTGNFIIKIYLAEVLFDFSATYSFISNRLVSKMQKTLMSRHSILSIALSDRKMVNCQELFIDYPILIHIHEFLADLYRFELTEFDNILGMNW